MRVGSVLGLLVVVWLAIGVLAAAQRGYFGSAPENCAEAGTVAAAIAVGPLNYTGVNPKIDCELPHPSP
ncbi:hypothetical protein LVY72_03970 [Arthrobacter sp. I2-34]|uniref:Uncharacterized protein n=1 Tax=Arthrobacter hankyongi TaxID=2904801 RepID=A0ABS9L352_9MICC|nr:hypothetical protein [Arthrobacter hankyongi]MCG2621069.1 hypothetical protein [Arthrobacter hankyongi]